MMKIRKPPAGAQPNQPHAAYKSTLERAPRQPAIPLPQGATELSGPSFDRTVLSLCGARATTLIARRDAAGAEACAWNISMQGADETVFFEA